MFVDFLKTDYRGYTKDGVYEMNSEPGMDVYMVMPIAENEPKTIECIYLENILPVRGQPRISTVFDDPYRESRAYRDMEHDFNRAVKLATGEPDIIHALFSVFKEHQMSFPLHAAMHMGSTGEVLWSDSAKRYWYATYDNLTVAGKMLYHSWELAYERAPVLVTMLDT